MVRKNRSQLRDSRFVLEDSALASEIGGTLRDELGGSRRATKTVMRWTGVSDTTARSWLQGRASPSGLHLLSLAAHSQPVMILLLRLTGYRDLELGMDLLAVETGLEQALALTRAIRTRTY